MAFSLTQARAYAIHPSFLLDRIDFNRRPALAKTILQKIAPNLDGRALWLWIQEQMDFSSDERPLRRAWRALFAISAPSMVRVLLEVVSMGSAAVQAPAALVPAFHVPLDRQLARRTHSPASCRRRRRGARTNECDNWAVLPVSTTLASAFEQPMTVATMYRLATMEPLNSGSKGLWVDCSLNQKRYEWDGGVGVFIKSPSSLSTAHCRCEYRAFRFRRPTCSSP